MILADASVWLEHFRRRDPELCARLADGEVLVHDLVIEEVACARLVRAREVVELLESLPRAVSAEHRDVLDFIAMHGFGGQDSGCLGAQLLACAALSGARLYTHRRALRRVGGRLGLLHEPVQRK